MSKSPPQLWLKNNSGSDIDIQSKHASANIENTMPINGRLNNSFEATLELKTREWKRKRLQLLEEQQWLESSKGTIDLVAALAIEPILPQTPLCTSQLRHSSPITKRQKYLHHAEDIAFLKKTIPDKNIENFSLLE